MPTDSHGNKTGAAARAEAADDNSFVSKDTFENPAINVLKNTATVEDAQGIERIVAPTVTGYAPNPMEASDEEKEAAEKRQGIFEEARKTRLAALKGEVKDEERLVNNPAIGGSDGGTQTVQEQQTAKDTSPGNKASSK